MTDRRPTRIQTLMRQAEIVAERSTCSRAHVGVVIAQEARVVSQGYNGAPAGMLHCDHTCNCGGKGPKPECICPPIQQLLEQDHWDFCQVRYNAWEKDDDHLDSCHTQAPCLIAVHAEANAIAFAAKHGVATAGASLYTTVAPCLPCSQLIINAGIVRVVFGTEYRVIDGLMTLREAGIQVTTWLDGELIDLE